MTRTYSGTKLKAISVLYRRLRDSEAASTLYIKEKWERELNVNISLEEWHVMCETQHTTSQIQEHGGNLDGKPDPLLH